MVTLYHDSCYGSFVGVIIIIITPSVLPWDKKLARRQLLHSIAYLLRDDVIRYGRSQ